MKTLKTILLAILLIAAMTGIASAADIPATIDRVKVDGVDLLADQTNRLDLERGQEVSIEVLVTAYENIDDAEVEVFISGFEYNQWERASDISGIKDLDAGVTYKFKFKLPISDEFEEDDYKLRVLLSDRNNDELMQNYNLKIDVPRHSLRIDDVVIRPEYAVKAGSAILATVRVENKGEKDEDDVRVQVRIPELGVSATEYINEIENNDEEEETEEIFLRLPNEAKPGLYDLEIEVSYGEGYMKELVTKTIQVIANDLFEQEKPKTTITIGSQLESFKAGETAVYPITITNAGRTSRSYTLAVQQPEWASIKISPTSTVVLDGGKTQTLYVFVEAGKKAPQGAQVLALSVSSSGETLEQVSLTANITKSGSMLKSALEIVLVVLVVVLVIIGLIIGFSKLRAAGNDEDPKTETYY